MSAIYWWLWQSKHTHLGAKQRILCRKLHAYLVEAVAATLCEEDLDIGMAKQVILWHPLHNLDIAVDRQAVIPQHDQVRL